MGIFTEDSQGRFGSTPLSDVLTADSPASMKVLVQEAGGFWLKLWTTLLDALRTGEPQSRKLFGMEFWDSASSNYAGHLGIAEAAPSSFHSPGKPHLRI